MCQIIFIAQQIFFMSHLNGFNGKLIKNKQKKPGGKENIRSTKNESIQFYFVISLNCSKYCIKRSRLLLSINEFILLHLFCSNLIFSKYGRTRLMISQQMGASKFKIKINNKLTIKY